MPAEIVRHPRIGSVRVRLGMFGCTHRVRTGNSGMHDGAMGCGAAGRNEHQMIRDGGPRGLGGIDWKPVGLFSICRSTAVAKDVSVMDSSAGGAAGLATALASRLAQCEGS